MKSVFQSLIRRHTSMYKSNGSKITPKEIKYQFVLIFSNIATQQQLDQVVDALHSHNVYTYQTMNLAKDKQLIFVSLMDPEIILEQAENMHIFKVMFLYSFKLVVEREFQPIHEIYRKITEKLNVRRILDEKLQERLNKIDKRILLYENYKKFKYIEKHDFSIHEDDEQILEIFSPSEQMLIIYNYLHAMKIGDMEILNFLKSQNFLESLTPLHDDEQIKIKNTSDIEKYFGGNVAIYFEFMNYYQEMLKYLAIPALASILMEYSKIELSNLINGYALLTMIWSTFFLIFWKRKETELGIEWGILGIRHNNHLDLNPEFQGVPKISLISGHLHQSYSKSNRYFYYFVSLFEALPILIIAGFIKLLVFNINGLIRNKNSILYLTKVAQLNQEGGLLHYHYTATILDFLSIFLIFYINLLYTKICINSTRRENHKTNLDFYNSVILKRFLFELINRFFHLLYIAFGEFDILTLKNQLTKLFVVDQIRRVVLESLLPMLLKKKQGKMKESYKKSDDLDDKLLNNIAELELWEYDDFDDYIEVIFQYGYIVLFAAIFPLAAPLTYIFNFIEIWSDEFKLVNKLYQRNLPKKTSSIGQWRLVITILSVLSIYTNTAFISFSYWKLFDQCKDMNCDIENVLILLFVFEHITLGVKYFLTKLVQEKPKWVRVVLKRMKRRKQHYDKQ